MKKFSELNVDTAPVGFVGNKISLESIVEIDREFILHDYKVSASKFGEAKVCLTMQIELKGEKRVVFTGSANLIHQIKQVDKAILPITTKIIKEESRYIFS